MPDQRHHSTSGVKRGVTTAGAIGSGQLPERRLGRATGRLRRRRLEAPVPN